MASAGARHYLESIAERGNPIYYKKGQKPQGKAPDIFMGLFDTVYSFGSPFGKNDTAYRKTIASSVKAVAHATVKLEKRNTFDLWLIHSQEKHLNRTIGSIANGSYRAEKEFNGGHNDVGGAQQSNYHGYGPLKWVVEEGKKAGVWLECQIKTFLVKKCCQREVALGKGRFISPAAKKVK